MLRPAGQRGAGGPGDDCLVPVPDRRLDDATLAAVEIAVTSATVGDGLAFGNSTWLTIDLVDEFDPVLEPLPAPGSAAATLIDRLDTSLLHLNEGSGGFGEGLRGALDAAAVAVLDDELAGHGSRPADGSVGEIRAAINAVPVEPSNLWQPRRSLIALHSMAHLARRHGLGLLHGRDLNIDHVGTWQAGVLHRDA